MSGLWGLFMFFNITHQFKLLHNYNYRKKSLVMKIIIVCMNVQGFVVDIMVNRGLVGCIPQHVSEVGVGVIIKVEYKMTYFSYLQKRLSTRLERWSNFCG